MRRLFILILAAFLFCGVTRAQSGRDKIEALRVAFISKKLDLGASESQKFWPVYNEYNDKVRLIRRNLRQEYHRYSGTITAEEAEALYRLDLASRRSEMETHQVYSEKIRAIIGVQKFIRLRTAEEEFKKEMIKAID
jgi:hypothetical protein